MAYIEPDGQLIILKDVPLDPSYRNTLFFESLYDQSAYFASKVAISMYTDHSYQRVHSNTIRVEAVAEDLYNCNYLMFRNTHFGTKWFYAFITSVEYINNVTSEITYDLDLLQTWYFETEVMPCFVAREHTDDDTIGSNIVPESLAYGEYVANNYSELQHTVTIDVDGNETELTLSYADLCTVIAICDNDVTNVLPSIAIVEWLQDFFGLDQGSNLTMYDGVVSGCYLAAYDTKGIYSNSGDMLEYMMNTIDYWTNLGKADAIVDIYMVPFLSVIHETNRSALPNYNAYTYGATLLDETFAECTATNFTVNKIAEGDTLDGYTPKNNKLYTYPYSFLEVQNGNGETMICRYEFFDYSLVDNITFTAYGTITNPVQTVLKPIRYMGVDTTNNSLSLTLNSYPKCSWNNDYYLAWQAQTSVPYMINSLGGMVSSALTGIEVYPGYEASYQAGRPGFDQWTPGNYQATGLATAQFFSPTVANDGNWGSMQHIAGTPSTYSYKEEPTKLLEMGLDATSKTLVNVTKRLAESYTASAHADTFRGGYNNGTVNCASGRQSFYASRFSITSQFAEQIDDYFSMYGYATNRVKRPNIQDDDGNYRMCRRQWYYIQTEGATIKGSMPSDARVRIATIYNHGITFWKNPENVGDYSLDNPITS